MTGEVLNFDWRIATTLYQLFCESASVWKKYIAATDTWYWNSRTDRILPMNTWSIGQLRTAVISASICDSRRNRWARVKSVSGFLFCWSGKWTNTSGTIRKVKDQTENAVLALLHEIWEKLKHLKITIPQTSLVNLKRLSASCRYGLSSVSSLFCCTCTL